MWSKDDRLGRLLRIRFSGTLSAEEADSAILAIRRDVHSSADRVVFCGDLRGLHVLAPTVSEKFVALFRGDNVVIARSAMLLNSEGAGAGATVALQLERMVREGANPARRTFRVAAPLLVWLAEILTAKENAVAEAFLKSD